MQIKFPFVHQPLNPLMIIVIGILYVTSLIITIFGLIYVIVNHPYFLPIIPAIALYIALKKGYITITKD